MKKTATVRATIDPDKKRQAGEILARLGLTHSQAINIFYNLIVETRGLPFPVRLPAGGDDPRNTIQHLPKKGSVLAPDLLSHLRKSVKINRRLGEGLAG